MPYGIKKVEGGYKVYNKNTGKTYSKKPHKTRKEALAQQAAMYVHASPEGEGMAKGTHKKPVKEAFEIKLDIILDNL